MMHVHVILRAPTERNGFGMLRKARAATSDGRLLTLSVIQRWPLTRTSVMTLTSAAALAVLLAGPLPTPSAAGPGPGPDSGSGSAVVHMRDFAFAPNVLTVDAGTTVTVVNDDTEPHTFTAVDKSFDSEGLDLHQSWKHVFAKAGTYAYYCELHPSMKGRIVVRAAAEHTS